MGKEIEKRNSNNGIDNESADRDQTRERVGGRHGLGRPAPSGGGYLDNCIGLNFRPQKKRDPRLDELYTMGLPAMWLEVAEAIGVDNFLVTWRILDANPSNYEDNGMKLVPLRRYKS